ncbi:hypothetical protein [Spirillospora sp. NBC_01491]|uniref:hypothetical protein n=1 Tax=Spirillospora sp. NBC_01491 TaxID=2976007 RepID=UPI002E37CF2C|nr:hypothetical protein [Spirillospora sp. NBC_01491]
MTFSPLAIAFGLAIVVGLTGLMTLYCGRLVAGTAVAALGFAAGAVVAATGFGWLLAAAMLTTAGVMAALLISSLRLVARTTGPPPAAPSRTATTQPITTGRSAR